jgi:hypothetical protein
MGKPETKATLGYHIVQRQPNEKKWKSKENWKVFLNVQSITKLSK